MPSLTSGLSMLTSRRWSRCPGCDVRAAPSARCVAPAIGRFAAVAPALRLQPALDFGAPMKDENKQRLDQNVSGSAGSGAGGGGGLGDDQGTRVGSPTPGVGKKTGSGAEATEGIHSAD